MWAGMYGGHINQLKKKILCNAILYHFEGNEELGSLQYPESKSQSSRFLLSLCQTLLQLCSYSNLKEQHTGYVSAAGLHLDHDAASMPQTISKTPTGDEPALSHETSTISDIHLPSLSCTHILHKVNQIALKQLFQWKIVPKLPIRRICNLLISFFFQTQT